MELSYEKLRRSGWRFVLIDRLNCRCAAYERPEGEFLNSEYMQASLKNG